MFIGVGLVFAIRASDERMGPDCANPEGCSPGFVARLAEISAHPGPGFFPFALGLLLALLGLLLLFRSLVFESEGGAPVGAIGWRRLVGVLAAVCFLGAGLERIGFVVASSLATLIVLIAASAPGALPWRRLVWQLVAVVVVAWLLFVPMIGFAFALWPWFLR